jgi:hypothetical protein
MLVNFPADDLCGTDDQLRLIRAASGYADLNLFQEALDELDSMSPELKHAEEVLSLRGTIYLALESWFDLLDIALILVKERPDVCQYWIWLGHTMRMLKWYSDSESVLLQALVLHQFEPMIYFTLACDAARQGDLDSARSRLVSALALDHDICFMAMVDPDLQPLWADLVEDRQD